MWWQVSSPCSGLYGWYNSTVTLACYAVLHVPRLHNDPNFHLKGVLEFRRNPATTFYVYLTFVVSQKHKAFWQCPMVGNTFPYVIFHLGHAYINRKTHTQTRNKSFRNNKGDECWYFRFYSNLNQFHAPLVCHDLKFEKCYSTGIEYKYYVQFTNMEKMAKGDSKAH